MTQKEKEIREYMEKLEISREEAEQLWEDDNSDYESDEMREMADKALAMLDVDPQGFDVMDRKLLEAVIHRFDGGPVGLDNIAASIGEEAGTIEDVIEPYLIQQGFLQRTPRGRIATLAAFRHLGVTPPKASGQDLCGV